MDSDAGLLGKLGGPDGQEAARSLYRSYGVELYGFAVARLGDRGLAEEVVQEVFTRAWSKADMFDRERASVRTWLYAIARNAIVDVERRRGRRPGISSQEPGIEAADPAEPIEDAMRRHQIQAALARLTGDHRQVIVLVHFRGLRVTEVAELTGLPLGTVKSRLHYASHSLQLALEELGVTP